LPGSALVFLFSPAEGGHREVAPLRLPVHNFRQHTRFGANNPVPLINQPLVPGSVKPGSGGFTLTVNGTGFSSGSVLNWNGSSRVTEVISNSQLKATINATDVAQAGTASVTMVNPGKRNRTSSVAYFTVREPLSSLALAIDPHLTNAGTVTVGDFNNDGNLDVAVGLSNGTIQIYLGKGDGTFELPVNTNMSGLPTLMVAADFNNDGNLDLAVGDSSLNITHIFLGHGDGTLTEQEPVPGIIEAAGDWNGDGNLDLALEETDDFTQWSDIYIGTGNGSFGLGQQGINAVSLFTAAVGDFNGDGKLDLAFPGVEVLLGNGDGTFQKPVYHHDSNDGRGIVAVDVNGDGNVDLVTSGISVFLGDGKGGFKDVGGVDFHEQGYNIITGDFNGDGKVDLGVQSVSCSTECEQAISVFLGRGDGKFHQVLFLPTGLYSSFPTGFDARDFNGDGKLDLIIPSTNTTFLFLQTVASVLPTNLSFGDQNVGTKSAPQTAAVKNVGSSDLKIKWDFGYWSGSQRLCRNQ
jgi:hypothetical protein